MARQKTLRGVLISLSGDTSNINDIFFFCIIKFEIFIELIQSIFWFPRKDKSVKIQILCAQEHV